MIFKVYYTIGDYEDSYCIEADTIKEAKEIDKRERDKRGLDIEKNNLWSERIDE